MKKLILSVIGCLALLAFIMPNASADGGAIFVDEPETTYGAAGEPAAYNPFTDDDANAPTVEDGKLADGRSARKWKIGGCSTGAFPVMQQWRPGATSKVWGEPAQITYGHFMSYGNTYYWKCPNGTAPTKLKFYAYQFCASRTQGDSPGTSIIGLDHVIRGFWYNPYFAAPSGAVVNPGQVKLDWDGSGPLGAEHCTKRFGIAKADRVWMTNPDVGPSPWWEVGGHIDQKNMPDPHFNFDFTGNRHYVPWPGDDRMISP